MSRLEERGTKIASGGISRGKLFLSSLALPTFHALVGLHILEDQHGALARANGTEQRQENERSEKPVPLISCGEADLGLCVRGSSLMELIRSHAIRISVLLDPISYNRDISSATQPNMAVSIYIYI